MKGLRLIATGGALPGRTVTNEELSRTVDTSDEWITTRTGIRTRHYCTEGENAATLAIAAAKQALQRLLCGGNGQCGGVFALGAVVPGADAGAGGDPLVAGIHGAAQLFVGDRAAGQSPAGGDQTQTLHAFLISPI